MHLYISLMYALTFLIGIVTGYLGLSIQGDIANANPRCAVSLQKANTGVIILSAIMLTATIVLSYCSFTCLKDEKNENKDMTGPLRMYYGFMLALSIVLTTLGALMRDNANDTSNPCPIVKSKASIIMGLGITGIVVMLGPFALQFANKGLGMAKEGYNQHKRATSRRADRGVELKTMSPRSSMCGGKRSEA
jgi:heme A synthase